MDVVERVQRVSEPLSVPTASSTLRLRHRLRPRRQDRRRPVPGHRRTLLRRGRKPHSHRTPRKGRRRHDAARWRLQAPHLPYAYQGMGPAGLDLLCEASAELDMPIVTEIMDPRDVQVFLDKKIDVMQIAPATRRTSPCSRRSARPRPRSCSSAACPAPSTSCSWLPSTS